jgi:hypothetical protein
MAVGRTPIERALVLAAVTGLKLTFGPALLATARRRPERHALAMGAMGEMVVDKIPFLPSRSALPLLVPRAMAGYWVAKTSLEEEGITDQGTAALGAAVAAGVATVAPLVRGALHTVLRVPDPLLGALEDYLALKYGGEAVGLTMEDLRDSGAEAWSHLQEKLQPESATAAVTAPATADAVVRA